LIADPESLIPNRESRIGEREYEVRVLALRIE
jgi:hypothetical protein